MKLFIQTSTVAISSHTFWRMQLLIHAEIKSIHVSNGATWSLLWQYMKQMQWLFWYRIVLFIHDDAKSVLKTTRNRHTV